MPEDMSMAPRFAKPRPSCRYARDTSPIFAVGKSPNEIDMSIAVVISSMDLTKCSTRNDPSAAMNFTRFSEARLHEELSRCMYSLHGLDAVIRPLSGQVCQSLMVESYWMPGSAHSQAACAIFRSE